MYICCMTLTKYLQVFTASFNNISVISWQSVLLVEETGIPTENQNIYIWYHYLAKCYMLIYTSVEWWILEIKNNKMLSTNIYLSLQQLIWKIHNKRIILPTMPISSNRKQTTILFIDIIYIYMYMYLVIILSSSWL